MSRRSITTAAVLAGAVAALSPGAAAAGTYDVLACGGGPNYSWTPSATPGMSASPGSPACSADGLVAEDQTSGAHAAGSAARWRFDAPPGSTVTGVAIIASYGTSDARWQAVLSNGRDVLQGCPAGTSPCLAQGNGFIDIPPSQTIYTEAFCTSGTCPSGTRARVTLRSAAVRVSDLTPPSIVDPSGPAWTSEWLSTTVPVTFGATDASGISAVSAEIDGKDVGYQSRACDPYLPRCDDWTGSIDVNVRNTPDGPHTLGLRVADRAQEERVVTRQVVVDNTAPALPENLALAGEGGPWRPQPKTTLSWTNPAQAFAPVVGASYSACSVATGECVEGDGNSPTSLELPLPQPGLYSVQLWLRDAAGNATKQNAAAPIQVGWDADAPTDVAFAAADADNPAVIRVVGKDATSGIADGAVEYRRKGAKAWRPIKTTLVDGAVQATMPDGRLRDGRYQLRATVRDAAGNARTTARRVNGRAAGVTLPLRVKARMQVGKARRAGRGKARRTRFDSTPRVRVRRSAQLSGRLVAPGGNPIAGAPIDVATKPAGAGKSFVAVAKLKTDAKGRFRYTSPAGANRTVRFIYAGAAMIRPQLRRVRVRVPAESTIRASRRSVVNGETVRFAGRITTRPLPSSGKLVELQFFDRGRWRTFRTTHADQNGRWHYTYRFSGTVGRRVYRFRVHTPRESGYTYAEGGSRAVRVTVQGL